MRRYSQYLSELFIVFTIAFLSIVVSFLCIDIFFSLLEWALTGKLKITLKGLGQVFLSDVQLAYLLVLDVFSQDISS